MEFTFVPAKCHFRCKGAGSQPWSPIAQQEFNKRERKGN